MHPDPLRRITTYGFAFYFRDIGPPNWKCRNVSNVVGWQLATTTSHDVIDSTVLLPRLDSMIYAEAMQCKEDWRARIGKFCVDFQVPECSCPSRTSCFPGSSMHEARSKFLLLVIVVVGLTLVVSLKGQGPR